VTIFGAARILGRATYQKPSEPNEAISFVLVNGVEVVKETASWSMERRRGAGFARPSRTSRMKRI
jgi:hypothetical protein